MALNFPDPAVTNPWYDGIQWWEHDGDGWLRIPVPTSAGSIMTGFKNVLINGDFRVTQRGSSGTTTNINEFLCDRWYQQSGDLVSWSIDVDTDNTLFMRRANAGLLQKIEDVRTFNNEPATLSFWFRMAQTDAGIPIRIYQNFGVGGSSQETLEESFVYPVANVWQKVEITFQFPSLTGKTIGANSYLQLAIYSHGTASVQTDHKEIQFERGSAATPFEVRSIQQELALCQRYYQILNTTSTMKSHYINGVKIYFDSHTYPTEMRTTPSIILSNFNEDNFNTPTVWSANTGGFTSQATSLSEVDKVGHYRFRAVSAAEM